MSRRARFFEGRRVVSAFVAGIVVLVTGSPNGAMEQDALTRLRAALGGETALGNVQTIRARGTIANKPLKNHVDIACAIPARFVRVICGFSWSDASWSTDWAYAPGTWQPRMEPALVGGDISDHEHVSGFDGMALLPERSRAYWASNQEAAAVSMDSAHARLAEFILPLLGATPTSYPVEATSEGNAIMFRAAGSREWRVDLDAVTHLPTRMSWSYPVPPNATSSAKRTQAVTEFSDYRPVGHLNWPHRLVTTLDGNRVEDATVTRYDVNVRLSDKMFRK